MPRLWRNLRWERLSARMEKSRELLERYTIKGVYLCPVVVFQFMCFRVIYVHNEKRTLFRRYIE